MKNIQYPLKIFLREIKNDWRNGRSLIQLRHYRKWKKSLSPEASAVKDRLPWITFDAIEILKNSLKKSSTVFEFGAGGSTLFFLDHADKVISVEHSPQWLNLLKNNVSPEERHRWTPILAEPEANAIAVKFNPSVPSAYLSSGEMFNGYNFEKYATSIESFSNTLFDVVAVDGRARPSCIMHSLDKVKPGGLFIVDNAERSYYFENTLEHILKDFSPLLQSYGAIPYNPTFTITAIWKRNIRPFPGPP